MTRLSKPPQEKPIPNNSSPSSMAATASFRAGFRTTENRPVEPLKSRRDGVARIALERRMQDRVDLRPGREPARQFERLALVLLEAQAQCAQAPQGKED